MHIYNTGSWNLTHFFIIINIIINYFITISTIVIYDDKLTEAFLSTLSYLVSTILEAPPTVIITTERR